MSTMPDYLTEKNSFRLEFQNVNYSREVAQKLTYEKVSRDIFFLFSPIFLMQNNFTDFFFTNGFQLLHNFIYPNIAILWKFWISRS